MHVNSQGRQYCRVKSRNSICRVLKSTMHKFVIDNYDKTSSIQLKTLDHFLGDTKCICAECSSGGR